MTRGLGLEEEPWRRKEFFEMPRRQQNVEIYEILANTIVTMTAGIETSKHQLAQILKRVDVLENEQNWANTQSNEGTLEYKAAADSTNRFVFPVSKLGDYTARNQAIEDWQYSPRSNTPTDILYAEPDMETIAQHKIMHPKVIMNVGGLKHEVMWKMLEKKPLTRLGKLARAKSHDDILNLVDAYSLANNEIYFDRDPATFNCILNFYRTNRLHMIDEVCINDYADDLEFWMIKDINLEICCIDKFTTRREHILAEIAKEQETQGEEEEEEDFGDGYFARYQQGIWDLFEKPQSSLPAKILSLLSITLVLASLVAMCLNTFTWLQAQDVNGDPVDNPKLALIEAICISYFTVEFLLRLAGAPKKLAFLKGTMNIVDTAAIAPYYITLFFMPPAEIGPIDSTLPTSEPEEESAFGDVGRLMQVFRIARIMRIFKLARRSVGLQSIAHTVRTSWKDLGLLFMLVGMGMLVFGSLEYYIENGEEDTGFTSIPQGMWWAVQTLTSLGYGDFWPTTVLGKIIGSMCAVCGVLVMALPIPIVVDNFADYYSEQKKLEAKELKKEAQAKQAKVDEKAEQIANQALVQTIVSKPVTFSTPPMSPDDGSSRVKENGRHQE